MIALLNTSICTSYGSYEYTPTSLDSARRLVHRFGYESFIGHESTAQILARLLEVPVGINRESYHQQIFDRALVFKLNARITVPHELSVEEVEEIGYEFGVLERIA